MSKNSVFAKIFCPQLSEKFGNLSHFFVKKIRLYQIFLLLLKIGNLIYKSKLNQTVQHCQDLLISQEQH